MDELTGTPQVDATPTVDSSNLTFPENGNWNTPVSVTPSQPEDAVNQAKNLPDTTIQQADPYEPRYKELQGWATKVSQRNSELEKAIAIRERDIEHLIARNTPTPSLEDWQESISSRDKFEGYLAQRDAELARVILQNVPAHLESHPVIKEAKYRMSLDRAVARADKEGVSFDSLLPEIESSMSVNPLLNFEQAYEKAKELATKNGKQFAKPVAGVATRSDQAQAQLRAKADRLKTEVNAASGEVKRLPKPEIDWKADPRDRMEQALARALEREGLA